MKPSVFKPLSIALLAAAMAATSMTTLASADKAADAAQNNQDWYQVWTADQAVIFDDHDVYMEYLKTGTAPVLKKLDSKDYAGRSVVLGLRADQASVDVNSLAAKRFLDINLPPASDFYGEVRQDNKIFVFRRYGDMIDTMKLGSPIFSYVELGAGPKGERVVFVLAKEEGKPEALISKFHSLNR
ncbi:MAG: hypothetical protein ACI9EB_000035 [Pseudomonas sp.]|jgi:hypothetical protein